MRTLVRRFATAVGFLSSVQWLVTTVGALAGSSVVVAALGHAERWQMIVGGVGAFVLVAMLMLAINMAAAGGVKDELPFYLAYRSWHG
jgi:hypothetical protein